MRSTFWLIAVLLAGWSLCRAQEMKGTREISWSGQFGHVSSSHERTYQYGDHSTTYRDESKYFFFLLAMRFGAFVTNHIEIAPEINWTKIQAYRSAINLSGNLEYNFDAIAPSGRNRNIPFLLAGYGIGNAVPRDLVVYTRSSEKFDVPVLNLGAGLKTFVTERVAMRLEYRYQRFSWDHSWGTAKSKYLDQYHRVLFGISLFTPRRSESALSDEKKPPESEPTGKKKPRRDREMGE